jgi:hypothetical protein
MRLRAWAIGASAIALFGGSFGGAVAVLRSPTAPLAPTPLSRLDSAVAPVPSQTVSTEAQMYRAALQSRPTPNAGLDSGTVYVESVRCRGDVPGREPCDLAPIPSSIQVEVTSALPEVRFVTRQQAMRLRGGVLVRFGPITYSDGAAARAYLPVDVRCGVLCGEGTTLVLTARADGTWAVVGTSGRSWIS